MKKFTIYLVLCLPILVNFSCSQPQLVTSAKLGSSLNDMGEITNSSLDFIFSKVENPKKSINIFDSILFDGGVICFSFAMKNSLLAQTVLVQFVNTQTGEKIHVDSIRIHKKNIYGFISVGNALEFIYKSDLHKSPPKNHYANEKINFIIRLTVSDNSEKIVYDLAEDFSISYDLL